MGVVITIDTVAVLVHGLKEVIRLAIFNLARVFNKSLIKRDEPFSYWK